MTFDVGDYMKQPQDPSGVCFVDPTGQLICNTSAVTAGDISSAELKKVLGRISDAKLHLILGLINEVLKSPITDKCIAIRSSDIVGSVHVLLDEPPPVMLLYRYIRLPGNIMATYFIHQNEFDAARVALDEWAKPKAGC